MAIALAQPVDFTYENICYEVPDPKAKVRGAPPLRLLRDVTGVCRPGTMTALMGASGAGKTTLLDVLANRKTTGAVGGAKVVNGAALTPASFARVSGYAEQEDVHIPNQTVAEALAFSAALRLPASVPAHRRDAFVEEVLGLLELSAIADCQVGAPSGGASG